jgi:hypothetical protein
MNRAHTLTLYLFKNHSNNVLDRAMAQAISRRPFTAEARGRARVNPWGFVLDEVALLQIFLRVLQFPL